MTSIYTLVYPLNGADDNESSINSLNISIPLSDVSFLTVATSLGRSFQETYDDEDLTVTTPSELLVTFVEFIVKFLNSSSAQELSQESREIHVRFLYDVSVTRGFIFFLRFRFRFFLTKEDRILFTLRSLYSVPNISRLSQYGIP